MNPIKELKEKGIITSENKISSGIIRSGFRELHINTNPLRFQVRELDDNQIIRTVTHNNAPIWAKHYIEALSNL